MCQVLYREGGEWACKTIQRLHKLPSLEHDWKQVIQRLEPGTKGRPPAYVRGVQSVIEEVRMALERAARAITASRIPGGQAPMQTGRLTEPRRARRPKIGYSVQLSLAQKADPEISKAPSL